ncbi:neutral zinc metallopeptidase [Mycolicibacterium pyrenivorans]|uniref:neutral zinc metallopeptidase n=1 Tax=Mycolicibacterium pyrenivorans TaxID=187102 RepID=UPI0021F2A808|nr:neutral zinc metallopeptidase [Mycolicibacterium pyrenivorans]MCV7155443.1 neutral zinc metallopeptidase [Mycolicibacterium pyrenivorans]
MGMRVCAALVVTAVVSAGCAGPNPQPPAPGSSAVPKTGVALPDISGIKIHGDESDPINRMVMQAIADLESYWGKHYPELYETEFEPIEGGYYAAYPSSGEVPPCATDPSDISGNAFYCYTADVVAWDAEGLLPELSSKYGDFVIPVVMAHEFGHAIQGRSNYTARTVTKELQADCFAGAWSKHALDERIFDVNAAQLDSALAGVLDLRDQPGTSKMDPNAHGSGFDRVSAFQDGYDNGPDSCKDYRDDDPMVLALPFNDAEDEARGGNMPYDSVLNTVPYDLEDYWTQVYPEVVEGQQWVPVRGLEPFDPYNPPDCGGDSTDGYALFYCVPDDYIGWDNEIAMRQVYRQGGDYAVATLLATQYGLAALERLNDQSQERTSTLRSDCLAGAYTASVILHNRPETSTFSISPGDLDEGIKALLVFCGDGDVERQGAGYARVRAFREGVMNGVDPCLSLEP